MGPAIFSDVVGATAMAVRLDEQARANTGIGRLMIIAARLQAEAAPGAVPVLDPEQPGLGRTGSRGWL